MNPQRVAKPLKDRAEMQRVPSSNCIMKFVLLTSAALDLKGNIETMAFVLTCNTSRRFCSFAVEASNSHCSNRASAGGRRGRVGVGLAVKIRNHHAEP